jgi:AraC family transcriptional regulator
MPSGPLSPASSTVLPRMSHVLRSSISLPWHGFIVEHLACSPGEQPESEHQKHVISMVFGRPSRIQTLDGRGRLVSHIKPRGSITIKPAGIIPYVRLQSHAESIHCTLDPNFTMRVLEELDCKPTSPPKHHFRPSDTAMRRIMILLAEELGTSGQSGRLYAESLANIVAVRFLQGEYGSGFPESSRVSALPPKVLRRVQERMETELHLDLSLSTFAAEAGYSRTHFLRMFHAAMGMNPHQYLVRLRIDRAKTLLAKSGNNLIDIASACGFSSQSHMTMVFSSTFGDNSGRIQTHLLIESPSSFELKSMVARIVH